MLYTPAFGMPGAGEWLVIVGIALAIFHKRLPALGRAVGRKIVEFKKALKAIDDEFGRK